MNYRLATEAEKQAWREARELYPLHAVLTHEGHTYNIEDLRGSWGGDDPTWEVHAPKGYHFGDALTHSMLERSIRDVKATVLTYPLDRCSPASCGEER